MMLQELQSAPVAQTALTVVDVVVTIFSGVTLVVVIAAAMRLQATLTTLTVHVDLLKNLPREVSQLDGEVKVIKKDVHNLWQAFRDYVESNADDENRYVKFLRDWDARHTKEPPDGD